MSPQSGKKVVDLNLPILRERTEQLLKNAGAFTYRTVKIPHAFIPLTQLLANEENVEQKQLSF